jgi:predicted phosphoribosyltransferase
LKNGNDERENAMNPEFRDRSEAGKILARDLTQYRDKPGVVVLGLARGGVPVAFEIARSLNAPLDVFIARKLGVPGHEEFAMGAVATGGVAILNRRTVKSLRIPQPLIDLAVEREGEELRRRERLYRANRPPLDVTDCTVILVDDGIATGATMRAAIDSLRRMKAKRIVVATPVAALPAIWDLREIVDRFIAIITPADFRAVGEWYENFWQVSDQEVQELLNQAVPILKAAA